MTLNTGVQYALVLKPAPGGDSGSSLAWRRSSTPTDPSNPYSGGDLWTYNLDFNDSMQPVTQGLGLIPMVLEQTARGL